MYLPFDRQLYWSTKNGFVFFNKNTGEIWVRGHKQTSTRYPLMWQDALKRCPGAERSTRVLLLGLAGGGALFALHNVCSNARVTALEHDPIMVALARTLHRSSAFPFPEVLLGDAQTMVPCLQKEFDLILVDLFLGGIPPAFTAKMPFWSSLKESLLPGGVVLFNLAGTTGYEGAARASFVHGSSWMYNTNRLLALWDEPVHTAV